MGNTIIPWFRSRSWRIATSLACGVYIAYGVVRFYKTADHTTTWGGISVHVRRGENVRVDQTSFTLTDNRTRPSGELVLVAGSKEYFTKRFANCNYSRTPCRAFTFGADSNVRCLVYRGSTTVRFGQCRFMKQAAEARFTCLSKAECVERFANVGLDYSPVEDPD
jgi:hypothetical protein